MTFISHSSLNHSDMLEENFWLQLSVQQRWETPNSPRPRGICCSEISPRRHVDSRCVLLGVGDRLVPELRQANAERNSLHYWLYGFLLLSTMIHDHQLSRGILDSPLLFFGGATLEAKKWNKKTSRKKKKLQPSQRPQLGWRFFFSVPPARKRRFHRFHHQNPPQLRFHDNTILHLR